jgi:SAM-dependent methyltransferase
VQECGGYEIGTCGCMSISYNEWHLRYGVDVEAATPWHLEVRKRLPLNPGDVLEIGCGRGGFACWLAENTAATRLTAMDFAETAVQMGRQYARSQNIETVHWRVGDILALPFGNDVFDTVLSCETIEHVPDPRGAISELARVLRPGGTLIVTCSNYLNLTGLYRIYLRFVGRKYSEEGQPINNILLFPFVRWWLKRTGLKLECADSVGHYVPFPGRPPIRFQAIDGRWFGWFGLHAVFVATKPLLTHPQARQGAMRSSAEPA